MHNRHTLILALALNVFLAMQAWAQESEPVSEVLIANVNIFDGKNEQLALNMSVLIEGNKIAKIANSIEAPQGAKVIDGDGRTLMPGLIDAHVHLAWNTPVNQLFRFPRGYLDELTLKEAEATLMRGYAYGAFSTAIGAEFMRGPNWLERFGGKKYSAVELMGKPLTKEKIEELQKSDPGEIIIFHFLDEEDNPDDQKILDYAVLYPGGSIGSDGMPWMNAKGDLLEGDVWPVPDSYFAHPRRAGCFSRLFARWVRERKVLSLSEAVRKCSLIPAQILEEATPQMKKKGRVQVGCDADIVVFDPNTIEDKATFVKPNQTSVGFRHVVVNGTPIIEQGNRIGDARPGRPVRRPV